MIRVLKPDVGGCSMLIFGLGNIFHLPSPLATRRLTRSGIAPEAGRRVSLSLNALAGACKAVSVIVSLSLVAVPTSLAGIVDKGVNDDVLALAVHNGSLIAGGRFTLAGDLAVNHVARWDGTTWHALGEGVAGVQYLWDDTGDTLVIDPVVNAMTIYDGHLIVGGSFTTAGGTPAVSVAGWDGTGWFPLGEGIQDLLIFNSYGVTYYFPPQVLTLTTQNGDLIVGGIFDQSGSSPALFVARWDGSTWTSVGEGVGGGLPPRVRASLALGTDLYTGGFFNYARNISLIVPVYHISRWDGMKWYPLESGFGPNSSPFTEVRDIASFAGEVIAGGNFQTAGSVEARNVAAWNGTTWRALGEGIPNSVHALVVFRNQLYAGAYRWEETGWVNALQTNGPVLALLVHENELYVGGDFSLLDGVSCQNIAAWSGPTPVYLISFDATRQGTAALLQWEVAFASEHAGFTVWRQSSGEEKVLVGIPEADGSYPLQYRFLDQEAPGEAVDYWLLETSSTGALTWFGPAHLEPWTPTRLQLAQNRPNPFNPQTTLHFTLAQAESARLAVYDSRGQLVTLLLEDILTAGEHTASWNGLDARGHAVASGVYVVRLETLSGRDTRKITLNR